MSENKHHNLSVLLLKEGFSNFDQAIKKYQHKFPIEDASQPVGTLYLSQSHPVPPKWSTFFQNVIKIQELGTSTTVAAVLLIELESKIFAITFGQGRYLLQPDCWVERFGLKVALNSIGKQKIRTIDKFTFDAISRQSKEQASKETDAKNFGMDIEQDLLRAVTGVPKDTEIGTKVYGMDSLCVSTNTKIGRIKEWLGKIYAKYEDDSYKRDFPWVDHISEVKDKLVIANLDALLVSQIAAGNLDRIWMAVPEIIEWSQVGGFCFKMNERAPEHADIHLPDFLTSLSGPDKENMSRELFSRRRVYCINSDGSLMNDWQAYKCLYCELEQDSKAYLLSGGKWYAVDRDFVASVNQSYKEIYDYPIKLPKFNDVSEGAYNERVVREMGDYFVLMHDQKIPYGGGHSQIEFCDLLSVDRDIVHVKRYGSSNVLSHLFAQGRQSGELFRTERGFREKVAEKIPGDFSLKDLAERPESDAYQIVYAIISDIPGVLNIPFFSRLNLRNSARTLTGLGYRVAKLKIDVAFEKAKMKKYRKRKKKT